MGGVVLRLSIAALIAAGAAVAARAEDLIMPFSCQAGNGELRVGPAPETTYRIIGHRDEQPFLACSGARPACETMMVHRFAIDCNGAKIAWAHVAAAAHAAGFALPSGLPVGFAPVSTMSGRFVLPALVAATAKVSTVSTENLASANSVEGTDEPARSASGAWTTQVQADAVVNLTGNNALRLAVSLASVLTILMGASFVASGRWRDPLTGVLGLSGLERGSINDMRLRIAAGALDLQKRLANFTNNIARGGSMPPSGDLENALARIRGRAADLELKICALQPEMLLRDVLASEMQSLGKRLADVERLQTRRPPSQSIAIIHNLMRELDRIGRITLVAAEGTPESGRGSSGSDPVSMPVSITDAYRVLGMNADAAPAVAKKLVDALRMSWHPDHARDAGDLQRREARMKQINAAWDMINERRAAA